MPRVVGAGFWQAIRPARGLAIGSFVFGAIAWISCAVYDPGLLGAPPVDGGANDGALPEGAQPDGDGCPHKRWPGRPSADDGDASVELTVAMSAIYVDPDKDAGAGYDLDGVCSCPGAGSCKPPATATADECDYPGGRDDSAGRHLMELSRANGLLDEAQLNVRLAAAQFGLVFRLLQYNGGMNDTQVTFALHNSNGLDAPDGGTAPPPQWDGSDRWTLDTDSLFGDGPPGTDCGQIGVCIPKYADPNAYVANGVLVAVIDAPELPVWLSTSNGPLKITFGSNLVTAEVVRDGNAFKLENGQIVGRWPAKRLLTDLGTLPDPLGGGGLCGANPSYLSVKSTICAALDVTTDLRRDGTGTPCDALSMALGFKAVPALRGKATPRGALPQPCGPAWNDSCN